MNNQNISEYDASTEEYIGFMPMNEAEQSEENSEN